MTVGELREMLKGVDDSMLVLIPASAEFDGLFYSPCIEESGKAGMGMEDVGEEEMMEMGLLGKEPEEVDTFLLVPCGFGQERDVNFRMN